MLGVHFTPSGLDMQPLHDKTVKMAQKITLGGQLNIDTKKLARKLDAHAFRNGFPVKNWSGVTTVLGYPKPMLTMTMATGLKYGLV